VPSGKRGAEEAEQGRSSLYALFYRVAKRALAVAEMNLVACIIKAARGDPPVTTTSTRVDREGNTIKTVITRHSQGAWQAAA
jgi:hypothetical protein